MENRLLWNRNKTLRGDKIPMWKIDYYGNTIKSANVMNFQCGKKTIVEARQKLRNVMKFHCGNRQLWKRN